MSCLPGMPCFGHNHNDPNKINCGINKHFLFRTTSNFVNYSGPNLPCIGVQTCETLTSVIEKVDSALCGENLVNTIINTLTNNPALLQQFMTIINNNIVLNCADVNDCVDCETIFNCFTTTTSSTSSTSTSTTSTSTSTSTTTSTTTIFVDCWCYELINDTIDPISYTYTDCATENPQPGSVPGNTTVYQCAINKSIIQFGLILNEIGLCSEGCPPPTTSTTSSTSSTSTSTSSTSTSTSTSSSTSTTTSTTTTTYTYYEVQQLAEGDSCTVTGPILIARSSTLILDQYICIGGLGYLVIGFVPGPVYDLTYVAAPGNSGNSCSPWDFVC